MKYLKMIWEAIKVPVLLYCFFFIAGIGFALGVARSDAYNTLLNDRVLIIKSIDLSDDSE